MKSAPSNITDQELVHQAKVYFEYYADKKQRDERFNEYHKNIETKRNKVRSSLIYGILESFTKSVQQLKQHGCFESDKKARDYFSLQKFLPLDLQILCFNALKTFLEKKLHEQQVLNIAINIMIQTKRDPESREVLRSSTKYLEVQPAFFDLFDKINSTLDYFIENTATFAHMNENEMLTGIKESLPGISTDIIINCFNTLKNQIWNESNMQYINEYRFFETKRPAQLKEIMKKMLPFSTNPQSKNPDTTFTHDENAISQVYDHVFKDEETIKKFSLALNNEKEILALFEAEGITVNIDGHDPADTLLACVEVARREINLHANFRPRPDDSMKDVLYRLYQLDR